MKVYLPGAKPKLQWRYYNSSGVLADPDTSFTIAIYDPMGVLVSASATETLTKVSTGIYKYVGYTIPATPLTGVYEAIATFTDNTSEVTRDGECVVRFKVRNTRRE